MSWWQSVVQIKTPNGLATGTFIGPQTILTAAHVFTGAPGPAGFVASAVQIAVRYQPVSPISAVSFMLSPAWVAAGASAAINDFAIIRTDVPHQPLMPFVFDASLDPIFQGAAFGYADDGNGGTDATTTWGHVSSSMPPLLQSSDLVPEEGMSGGPIMRSTATGMQMIGVVRGQAAIPGQTAVFGLLVQQAVINAMGGIQ